MTETPFDILLRVLGTEDAQAHLKKLADQTATVTEKFDELDRQAQSTAGSMRRTFSSGGMGQGRDALRGFTDETLHAKDALGGLTPSVTEFGKQFHNAADGAPKFTNALDDVATKTKSLGDIGRGLAGVLQQQMGSMIAVTGSAIGLFEAYDSVGDSQLAVEKAQRALMTSTNTLSTLEIRLANAIERHGANSAEVAVIQDKIAAQRLDIANKTGDLQNAEENLAIVQTHFAKEIGPLMLAMGGSIMTMFANGKETIKGLRESFTGLIPAIRGATAGMTAMGLVPWLLPLTIASGVIVAFTTNLFGFRDAINAAGEAIGNAIPMLKPFLQMLGDAGKWLTDTFGGGAEAANEFSDEFGTAMDESGNALNTFGETVDTETQAAIERWKKMIDAFIKEKEKLQQSISGSVLVDGEKFTETTPNRISTGTFNAREGGGPTWSKLPEWNGQVKTLIGSMQLLETESDGLLVSKQKLAEILDTVGRESEEAAAIFGFLDAAGIKYNYTTNSLNQATQERIKNIDGEIQKGKEEINVLENGTSALEKHIIGTEGLIEAYDKAAQEFDKYWAISKSVTLQEDLRKIAVKEVGAEFMKMGLETMALHEKTEQYNKALQDSGVRAVLAQKGAAQYNAELTNTKMATETAKGTLLAMQESWDSGESSIVAYNKALVDAQIAFEESKTELDALEATYDVLHQTVTEGQALQIAYTKGYYDQKIAIDETSKSLEARMGALIANNEALADGSLITQRITEAELEFQESLIDSVVEVEKLQRTYGLYTDSLNRGIPQSLAYAKAQIEVQMASAKLREELASLMGVYTANASAQNDMRLATVKQQIAFLEGKTGIQEWKQSLFDARNENAGMVAELIKTARSFGTEIPTALYTSVDAMKAWIEAQIRVPGAVEAGLKKAADNAKEALDELYEELEEGKLSGKDIEKALQANIPDSLAKEVKIELELKFNEQQMANQIDSQLGILATLSGPLAAKVGQHIADDIRAGLDKKLKDGDISIEFYNAMRQMLDNMPAPSDSKGFQTWITQFDQLTDAIENGASPETITEIVKAMTSGEAELSKTASSMQSYADAIAATNKSIEEYNKNTSGLFKNAEADNNLLHKLSAEQNTKGPGKTIETPVDEAVTVDTSAIDQAHAKLNTFNLAVAQIPTTIATAVSQGNSALIPLGDPLTKEVANKFNLFQQALERLPNFISTKVVTPSNNNLKPMGDPLAKEVAQKFSLFQQALERMPTFVSTRVTSPVVAEFNTMASSLQSGPFTQIQNGAAVAFQAVSNIARAEAPKMVAPYQNAVTNIINSLNTLQTRAASIFGIIRSDAQEAAGAIAALVSAINRLESKEVTITTRHVDIYETVYAAAGMGPTIVDHPTNLKVGESGPEFVQVIPLSSNANKNLSAEQRLQMYADPGKRRDNTAPLYQMATGNVTFPDGFPFHNQNGAPGANGQDGQDGQSGSNNNINNDNGSGANLDDVIDGDWMDVNIVAVGGRPVNSTNNALPIFTTGGIGGSSGSGGSISSGGTGSQTSSQSSQVVSGSTITQGTFGGGSISSVQQGPIYGNRSPLGGVNGVGNNISSQFQQIINEMGVFQNGQSVLFNGTVMQGDKTIGGTGIQPTYNVSGGGSGSLIGQVNNSNYQYSDLPSGKFYSNQNGVVNTNMTDAELKALGLPGSGIPGAGGKIIGSNGYPTSASKGSILEAARGPYRTGVDNQYPMFDIGAPNPLYESARALSSGNSGIGGAPGSPGTGGFGNILDILKDIKELLKRLGITTNINVPLDGDTLYKNQAKRYLGNLGTFLT